MAKRRPIPQTTQDEVLVASRRRCCICFALQSDDSEKPGQIAHLDKDNSNNSIDNLARLCLEHHDQYDSQTSQSKGMTIGEVKEYRAQLYEHVSSNLPPLSTATEVRQEPAEILPTPEILHTKSDSDVQQDNPSFASKASIALELGITEAELSEEIQAASKLLHRIEEANLTSTQCRLLATVVDNSHGSSVPRRVVESAAGYEYLSSEFFAEMEVLEFRGFLSFTQESDGDIHLSYGDSDSWQLLIYLSERASQSILDVIETCSMESLLDDVIGDGISDPDNNPKQVIDTAATLEDVQRASPSQPPTNRVSRLREIAARIPRPKIDLKLVIAALALLAAVFVIFYGNNLCQQSSPPPWTRPILLKVCPPTVTPTSQPSVSPSVSPSQSSPAIIPLSPTPIPKIASIGVIRIPDYIYTEIVPRLVSMGFDAEWIDYKSDYSDYRNYDIIYLPAGWGYQSAVLYERKSSFSSFLEQGGGLFIERPNAKDPFVAYFLPHVVSFAPEAYDPREYPSAVYADHPIIDGLNRGDLPEAGNLIENPDENYQILAVSAQSNHPTLLISEPLGGRVLIASSTLATAGEIKHPLSDDLVRSAVHWLLGEPN